jgi:hypothetical protein
LLLAVVTMMSATPGMPAEVNASIWVALTTVKAVVAVRPTDPPVTTLVKEPGVVRSELPH